jgi:hypothetical protein
MNVQRMVGQALGLGLLAVIAVLMLSALAEVGGKLRAW